MRKSSSKSAPAGFQTRFGEFSLDVDLEQVLGIFLKGVRENSGGESTISERESNRLTVSTKRSRWNAGRRPRSCEAWLFRWRAAESSRPLRQRINAPCQPLEPSVPGLLPTSQPAQSRRLPSSIPAFVGQIGNQRPIGVPLGPAFRRRRAQMVPPCPRRTVEKLNGGSAIPAVPPVR